MGCIEECAASRRSLDWIGFWYLEMKKIRRRKDAITRFEKELGEE